MNKKRIGNIGILDLRETQPEALDNLEWIDNVGAVLVSKDTEALLTKLAIGNLGGSAVVPKECKLLDGELALNHTFFAAGNTVNNLVNGTVKVEADVTTSDLEQGITFLAVNGLVLCPRDLIPVLQSKAAFIKGHLIPLEDNAKILIGKYELNHSFCQTFTAPTRLIVIGNVEMCEALHADDVRLLDKLEIVGELKIAEENLQVLGEKLVQSPTLHMGLIIPAGYIYLKQPLVLNAETLRRFNQANLFTRQRVLIANDVTADMLRTAISQLRTTDYVICPKALHDTVIALSDVTSEHLLTFTTELVSVEGKYTLTAAELKYRPARFALVVDGKLIIADDVAPEDLFQRLEHVYNFGKIVAGGEICAILQVKSKTRKGAIENLDAPKEDISASEREAYVVQNVGYLKL